MTNGTGMPAPPDAHLAATHERINGIERTVEGFRQHTVGQFQAINTSLDGISKDIRERNKTPWGVIFTGLGVLVAVLGTVGGLLYGPVKEGQSKLEDTIKEVAHGMSNLVCEKELATFVSTAAARRDDAQRATEDRFKRVETDVDKLQGSIVSRGEHDQHWAAQGLRDAELQRSIDEAKNKLESIYTPKDQIVAMQRHIDDLERAQQAARR